MFSSGNLIIFPRLDHKRVRPEILYSYLLLRVRPALTSTTIMKGPSTVFKHDRQVAVEKWQSESYRRKFGMNSISAQLLEKQLLFFLVRYVLR